MNHAVSAMLLALATGSQAMGANLDLDADNQADLWWFNASTGEHWTYLLDGLSLKNSLPLGQTLPGWRLLGRGDWNGDGKSDALWQHLDGRLWMYWMDGAQIQQQLPFIQPSPGWQLQAIADCNGDGTDDLLWFHAASGELWLLGLQQGKVVESRSLLVVQDRWRLLAAADIDADHQADLFWRNVDSGQVWLTTQDGQTLTGSQHWAWVDLAWQLQAVGDFDGNGRDDLWWRHQLTGDNALLLTQADGYLQQASWRVADLNWQPVLSQDINADGTDDLVWRNPMTGQNWLYLMQQGQVQQQGPLAAATPDWQLMQNPPLSLALFNQALVDYDFSAGDSLAAKNGWRFGSPDWPLTPVAGSTAVGIGFEYPGVLPGQYGWQEMRFNMPPTDSFWLQFRLHIPANYAHRSDTKIDLPADQITDWQLGDELVATDGQSTGRISAIYRQASGDISPGVFLRTADKAWSNGLWVGKLLNRNRQNSAVSQGRAIWPANNKLAAVWADDYSAHGLGPSVVWELMPLEVDTAGQTSDSTYLTVHYSAGNHQGAGGHIRALGEPLITGQDAGRYLDIVLHGQFSSRPGAKDGIIQSYLRKEGESQYRLKHDIRDADMDKRSELPLAQQPWQAGYLMGWSNSGFDTLTRFHISKIQYYRSRPQQLQLLAD